MPCSIVECLKHMAEIEPRVVLINPDGSNVEIAPTNKPGAVLLVNTIRTAVAAGIESGLLVANPFITAQTESNSAPAQTSRTYTLDLAVAHYKERLQDPQRLYELYQAVWDYHGVELMGLSKKDTRITDVPYKEDDIWQFMRLENPQPGNPGVELGYFHLPVLALSDAEMRVLIGKGFSNLGASPVFQPGYEIENGHQTAGWMRIDASLDAPYRRNKKDELTGLNVDELKEVIKTDKRSGQTVNIYGPSGNIIKQIFNYYPDQGSTWSRLPESLRDGRVLSAASIRAVASVPIRAGAVRVVIRGWVVVLFCGEHKTYTL